MFMPNSKPATEIDAAYVVQLQLQMHATGAKVGYLISWARMGISVFRVKYCSDFVIAAAKVLQTVISCYVFGSQDVQGDVVQLTHEMPDLRKHWICMYGHLASAVKGSMKLDLGGVDHAEYFLLHV
jgi:hypothetical protein